MHNTRSRALLAAGYLMALGACLGPALTACGGGSDFDPAHQRATLPGTASVEFAPDVWRASQTAIHQASALDLSYTNPGPAPAVVTCALAGPVAYTPGGGYSGGRTVGVQLVASVRGLPVASAYLERGDSPQPIPTATVRATVPAGELATCTTWLRIDTLSAGTQAAPAAVLTLSDAGVSLEVQP